MKGLHRRGRTGASTPGYHGDPQCSLIAGGGSPGFYKQQ